MLFLLVPSPSDSTANLDVRSRFTCTLRCSETAVAHWPLGCADCICIYLAQSPEKTKPKLENFFSMQISRWWTAVCICSSIGLEVGEKADCPARNRRNVFVTARSSLKKSKKFPSIESRTMCNSLDWHRLVQVRGCCIEEFNPRSRDGCRLNQFG